MRLIDSGSGIGHRCDAVTHAAPVYMCSRGIATPVGPSAGSGTVGQPEMSTECGRESREHSPTQYLGLASVWIEETWQTKHMCAVAISPSQVPGLCRNEKRKKKHEMADQRHLSLVKVEMVSMLARDRDTDGPR